VGPISAKKPGPGECPIEPALASVLKEHRRDLLASQSPGLAAGWMFPGKRGRLRQQCNLEKAWKACLKAAGISRRFTIHGSRYTFTDLTRLAKIDVVVRRALVGHMTEAMQGHYSSVALAEKRAAVASVHRLVPLGGDLGGEAEGEKTDQSSTSPMFPTR
jgi:integrase